MVHIYSVYDCVYVCVCSVIHIFPCRLESELKSLSDQLSAAPKQHQLESLQSAMTVVQTSLQQAKEQLQQKEETTTQLNEKIVQVREGVDECSVYMCTCTLEVTYNVHATVSFAFTATVVHGLSNHFAFTTTSGQ